MSNKMAANKIAEVLLEAYHLLIRPQLQGILQLEAIPVEASVVSNGHDENRVGNAKNDEVLTEALSTVTPESEINNENNIVTSVNPRKRYPMRSTCSNASYQDDIDEDPIFKIPKISRKRKQKSVNGDENVPINGQQSPVSMSTQRLQNPDSHPLQDLNYDVKASKNVRKMLKPTKRKRKPRVLQTNPGPTVPISDLIAVVTSTMNDLENCVLSTNLTYRRSEEVTTKLEQILRYQSEIYAIVKCDAMFHIDDDSEE